MRWQTIAIASIIGAAIIYVQIIKSERDDALATVAAMREAALKRNAEVVVLTEQGKRALEKLENDHKSDIQHIGELYGQKINNDAKSIADYRNQLANRLRQDGTSDSRVSENVTCESAGTYSDTTAAEVDYRRMYLGAQDYIKTLKAAGAVCAADYNMCREYVVSEQGRIGVAE